MLLNDTELAELANAAVQSGIYLQRGELLRGIPAAILSAIPREITREAQITSDLKALNAIAAGGPGIPAPLETWLKNAIALTEPAPEAAIFRHWLEQCIERQSHKTQSQPPTAVPIADGPLDDPFRTRSATDAMGNILRDWINTSGHESHPVPTPTTPERWVNTRIAPADAPLSPLENNQCLNPSSHYFYWLEIGALDEGSLDSKPKRLPTEHLPKDAELSVVLFSNPNGLELDPQADLGKLKLQENGSVIVSKRAGKPKGMEEKSEILNKRLYFPIKTPAQEGTYFFRSGIYFGQALVQSRHIQVIVAKNMYTRDALQSEVDYSLSHSLTAQGMEFLRGHQLSIFMNDGEEGTHNFRFFGREEYHQSVTLDGQELQNLINNLRNTMKEASWGEKANWTPQRNQSYRYEENPSFDRLRTDLVNMAIEGYRAYDVLADRLGAGPDGAEELRERMRTPGAIQFALKQSARMYLPIALLYDHKLDSWLDPAAYSLCGAFKKATASGMNLEQCDCFLGQCPNRDNDRIVCPGGFWGFRHALGLPITLSEEKKQGEPIEQASDLKEPLPAGQPLSLSLSFCDDPSFQYAKAHEEAMKGFAPAPALHIAKSRGAAIEMLKKQAPHAVYFYCHGGVTGTTPFLQIGPTTYERLGRDNLRKEKISWSKPRPLVFINGCHTTDLEPERAIDLVTGFVITSKASGVIGTEITIFEPLAVAFAQWFFQFFFIDKKSVGESIRLARLRILQKELNPLGLVYIPFAASTLRIS